MTPSSNPKPYPLVELEQNDLLTRILNDVGPRVLHKIAT